jgi:hypothetical protein
MIRGERQLMKITRLMKVPDLLSMRRFGHTKTISEQSHVVQSTAAVCPHLLPCNCRSAVCKWTNHRPSARAASSTATSFRPSVSNGRTFARGTQNQCHPAGYQLPTGASALRLMERARKLELERALPELQLAAVPLLLFQHLPSIQHLLIIDHFSQALLVADRDNLYRG